LFQPIEENYRPGIDAEIAPSVRIAVEYVANIGDQPVVKIATRGVSAGLQSTCGLHHSKPKLHIQTSQPADVSRSLLFALAVRSVPLNHHAIDPPALDVGKLAYYLIWIIGTIAHIHVVRATVDRGEVRQDDGLRVRIQKTANGRLTYIAGSCIAV
jgi:hypothetical protein